MEHAAENLLLRYTFGRLCPDNVGTIAIRPAILASGETFGQTGQEVFALLMSYLL